MRILFVADGRSPIALNWIEYFVGQGHEAHLASLYACQPELPLASLTVLPVAFTRAAEISDRAPGGGWLKKLAPAAVRTRLKHWLVPRTLERAATQLAELALQVQPDLIHAMRIPYEGMLAARAKSSGAGQFPLLISVWGNDFTLHAPSSARMDAWTRRAVQQADGLHTDCQRDLNLAQAWGWVETRPGVVLPGAGGVRLEIFHPAEDAAPGSPLTVINPRGLRAYARSDTFFQAAAQVVKARPGTQFLCPAMAGEPEAINWVDQLGLHDSVRLLPQQSRLEMAELFRQSQIALSITSHDGTPNTLLEAMACGCCPIAGDIESLREWIVDGENGRLVDPGSAQQLAEALLAAAADPDWRRSVRQINLELVRKKAAYPVVMPQAEAFYQKLITAAGGGTR
jgi:hypothetical protein